MDKNHSTLDPSNFIADKGKVIDDSERIKLHIQRQARKLILQVGNFFNLSGCLVCSLQQDNKNKFQTITKQFRAQLLTYAKTHLNAIIRFEAQTKLAEYKNIADTAIFINHKQKAKKGELPFTVTRLFTCVCGGEGEI